MEEQEAFTVSLIVLLLTLMGHNMVYLILLGLLNKLDLKKQINCIP